MGDVYVLEDPAQRAHLFAALENAGPFTVSDVEARLERRLYLDSFDWRLFRAGEALSLTAGVLRLVGLEDAAVKFTAPVAGFGIPRFVADLPVGPLRDAVAKRLWIRALVHRVSVSADVRIWEVRAGPDGIVLRCEETVWRPDQEHPSATMMTLAVRPVQGYATVRDHVHEICRESGLAPLRVEPQTWAFRASGLEPGGYDAKPRVPLARAIGAREGVRRLCRQLLTTMLQNEEGLRRDWDTEFLHDFRVAIRRTRSLLGQTKAAFAPGELEAFRRDFRALGRATGPLRDLDVHLLHEDRFRALLPQDLQPGLDSLFARLRWQRTHTLDALVDLLDGEEYRDLIRRWTAYLAPPPEQAAPSVPGGDEPVLRFARRRIRRQHRRILKAGGRIDGTTPPAALHRLRIECKKLRYLLELFADLFPSQVIRKLVRRLKTLQDHLGEFNDLSVQQRRLRADLASLPADGRGAAAEAAAIGGLLAVLAIRQREVRSAFMETFAGFARSKVTKGFAKLAEGDTTD